MAGHLSGLFNKDLEMGLLKVSRLAKIKFLKASFKVERGTGLANEGFQGL